MPEWIISALVGGGTALLVGVVALLTKLPEKLLDQTFKTKLENTKHELQTEIEGVRSELGVLQDRGLRSNELEYKAITEAWEQFVEAFVGIKNGMAIFSAAVGFEQLDDEATKLFVSALDLSEFQKNRIINAEKKDRETIYHRTLQQKETRAAIKNLVDGFQVLRKKGIFIPEELEKQLYEALDLLTKALTQFQSDMMAGPRDRAPDEDMLAKLQRDGTKIFDDLKAKVRARLMVVLKEK